jgi:hypothetical protein
VISPPAPDASEQHLVDTVYHTPPRAHAAGFFVATAHDIPVIQPFLLDPSVSLTFLSISVAPQKLFDTFGMYFDAICHFFLPHAQFPRFSAAVMVGGFLPDL